MEIVKPGTTVITVIGGIKAMVTGVCIRDQSVSYEISHFVGAAHHTTWIYRYEFEIDRTEKGYAGLKDFNNNTDLTLL